jgi:hypothetical protein
MAMAMAKENKSSVGAEKKSASRVKDTIPRPIMIRPLLQAFR